MLIRYLYRYSNKHLLHGVLYMQRISDNRMSGTATRNLRFFQDLCGPEALSNSIVVTTMWSNVERGKGEAREQELKTKDAFFKPVLATGGRMVRHDNTVSSAHSILRALLRNTPKPLRLQRELVDSGMAPWQTAAGGTMLQELAQAEAKHAEKMKKLKEEQAEALSNSDAEWQRDLEEEAQELEDERNKLAEAKKRLVELQIEHQQRLEQLAAAAASSAAAAVPPPPPSAPVKPAVLIPGQPAQKPMVAPATKPVVPAPTGPFPATMPSLIPGRAAPPPPTAAPARAPPPPAAAPTSSLSLPPMLPPMRSPTPIPEPPAPAVPSPPSPPPAAPAQHAPEAPVDATPEHREPEKKKKPGLAHKFGELSGLLQLWARAFERLRRLFGFAATGLQRILGSLFGCFGTGGDPERRDA